MDLTPLELAKLARSVSTGHVMCGRCNQTAKTIVKTRHYGFEALCIKCRENVEKDGQIVKD